MKETEFQEKLRELPDCKELGTIGRYEIIIRGIEALKRARWFEFTKKRRINAIIRKAVSNRV